MAQLKKTLTITQATGLGITIVVGSGMLLLPGLAYLQAGASSLYAWIACAVLVLPLLVIFAELGARYPTAGGVAGFMQHAFSRRAAAATEVLLIGTFGVGIPAIALTGGYYFTALLPASLRADWIATATALLLIGVAWLLNHRGAKLSGDVQRALAIFLVLALLLIPVLALMFANDFAGEGIAAPAQLDVTAVLALLGMVFFAFTGWEMLAFTAEEYKNPRRDFPISVALSFIIVTLLYFLLVVAVQLLLPRDHPLLGGAPLTALAEHTLGATAAKLTAALSFIVILANLIGAVWAASRLTFSSAREGLLPKQIARLNDQQTPRIAIAAACLVFATVLIANHLNWLTVSDLLRLAGQNFLILYGFAALAHLKTATGKLATSLGWLSLLMIVAAMTTFGAELFYSAGLLVVGYVGGHYRMS